MEYQNEQQSLLPELCEFIASLSAEYQGRLIKYLILPPISNDENTMHVDITKDDYIDQFRNLLDILQQLVCKRLLSRATAAINGSTSPNSDPVVIDATKCIAALCKYPWSNKYN